MAMDYPNNELPPEPPEANLPPPPERYPPPGTPPPGGYAYPPPVTQAMPAQTNVWAIVSLVSSVLGWLGLFGLGGLVGVIAGHVAKREIRNSNGVQTGDGLATAGLVLGYANIAVACLGLCLVALTILGLISSPFLCLPFGNQIQFNP